MKIKNLGILAFLMILSSSVFAQAETVADIANGLIPQFGNGVAPLLESLSYIFGICLGIKGVLKLKEHNETKGQQVKIHTPIILLVAAAMFLSLPKLIDTGISTFGFDKGGQQTFKF